MVNPVFNAIVSLSRISNKFLAIDNFSSSLPFFLPSFRPFSMIFLSTVFNQVNKIIILEKTILILYFLSRDYAKETKMEEYKYKVHGKIFFYLLVKSR